MNNRAEKGDALTGCSEDNIQQDSLYIDMSRYIDILCGLGWQRLKSLVAARLFRLVRGFSYVASGYRRNVRTCKTEEPSVYYGCYAHDRHHVN